MYMGGCQNYGAFLEFHVKGDIDMDVDIDGGTKYGWLSKI